MLEMMIDIETWDLAPSAEIRSIGWTVFEYERSAHRSTNMFRMTYANITPQSWRTRSPETEKWWSEQSEEAQRVFTELPAVSLSTALKQLQTDYVFADCQRVWAHGILLDIAVIQHAMKELDIEIPWKYSRIRDTRAIFDIFELDRHPHDEWTTKHHALHDAVNQTYDLNAARWIWGSAI